MLGKEDKVPEDCSRPSARGVKRPPRKDAVENSNKQKKRPKKAQAGIPAAPANEDSFSKDTNEQSVAAPRHECRRP